MSWVFFILHPKQFSRLQTDKEVIPVHSYSLHYFHLCQSFHRFPVGPYLQSLQQKKSYRCKKRIKLEMQTDTKVCDIHRLHWCIPVCTFTETQSSWGVCVSETEGPGGKGAVRRKKTKQKRKWLLLIPKPLSCHQVIHKRGIPAKPAALEQLQGT